jgi:hypothetical protein
MIEGGHPITNIMNEVVTGKLRMTKSKMKVRYFLGSIKATS